MRIQATISFKGDVRPEVLSTAHPVPDSGIEGT